MRKNFDETGTAGTFTGYVETIEFSPGIFNINGVAVGWTIYHRELQHEDAVISLLADAEHDVIEKLKELSIAPPKEKIFTEKLNELGYI